MAAKRRAGRPTSPPRAKQKSTISVRVSPDLKRFLDRESAANDRSLSAEAETLLERCRHDQTQAILFSEDQFGRQLAAILEIIGRSMRDSALVAAMKVQRANPDWTADPYLYDQAARAAAAVIEALRPEGDPAPTGDMPEPAVIIGDAVPDWVPSLDEQRRNVGVMIAAGLLEALGNPGRGGDIGAWATSRRDRLGSLAQRLSKFAVKP